MKNRFLCAFIFIIIAFRGILISAPDAVTGLAIESSGFRHAVLSWSTPYDTLSSTAPSRYEVRVSTYVPISTDTEWDNNSSVSIYPYRIIISTSEVTETVKVYLTVTGLTNGVAHFFAIKSSTDNLNWSAIDTSSPEPFVTPSNANPANVSGHNLMNGVVVNASTPTVSWSEPIAGSDDSSFGDYVASYTVEISTDINFGIKLVKDSIATTSWITIPLDENTTYYWRVRAVDSEGFESTGYLSQSTRRFIINAVYEYPGSFSLTSPNDAFILETSKRPDFQWTASIGDPDPGDSISYTVLYSTTPDFDVNFTTAVASLLALIYQPTHDLIENAMYYWKVFAVDQNGLYTVSDTTRTVYINDDNQAPNAFTLSSPSDTSMIYFSTLTFYWNQAVDPDPGDTISYTVLYSSYDATLSVPQSSAAIPVTELYMSSLEEDTTYYWRLQAIDSDMLGVQTGIWSFIVNANNSSPGAFDLIYSSGIISTTTPNLDWADSIEPESDAVTYTLYYSSYPDFSSYVSSAGLVSSSFKITPDLEENSTYFWKVEAIDIYSSATFSNQVWEFTVDSQIESPASFNLLTPANTAVEGNLRPSLDWDDSSDPDPGDSIASYTLYYSTLNTFAPQTSVTGINVSSYQFTSNLTSGLTYFWNVTAVASLTGQTTSSTWEFYLSNTAPLPFSLLYSSGIVALNTPVLDWNDTTDVQSDTFTYTVTYSSYSNFSVFASSGYISASEYVMPSLEENAHYYWYVTAIDAWGNSTQSTETFDFYVNVSNEAPASFSLVSPANTSTVETMIPVLDWADTTDPDPSDSVTYTVSYADNPSFTSKMQVSGLSVSNYTVQSNLTNGVTYYWVVYAVDSNSGITASSTWQFLVLTGAVPNAPRNVRARLISKGNAEITWEAPVLNTDGTTLTNLSGYRIFKAYGLDSLFTASSYATVGVSETSYTDTNADGQAIYYIVKAYNSWGVDGSPSSIVKVGGDTSVIIYPDDKTVYISVPSEILPSSITLNVSRLPEEETGNIIGSYLVSLETSLGTITSYKFSESLTFLFDISKLSASIPKKASSYTPPAYGIFWHNGVEWIYLGGKEEDGKIVVYSPNIGKYQIRTVSRSDKFEKLSSWPKIITPNADDINDTFNYTFENPYSRTITGKIYDINGGFISDMSLITDYWITWDGKDESGKTVSPGIYIYQIKCQNEVYNGTVVVAR